MRNTGRHVMKQTVESIMKSFQNSGKRHLVLTGNLRSGKTTRFREIVKIEVKESPTNKILNKIVLIFFFIIIFQNCSFRAVFSGMHCAPFRKVCQNQQGFQGRLCISYRVLGFL